MLPVSIHLWEIQTNFHEVGYTIYDVSLFIEWMDFKRNPKSNDMGCPQSADRWIDRCSFNEMYQLHMLFSDR
jgi:hypothetical protein